MDIYEARESLLAQAESIDYPNAHAAIDRAVAEGYDECTVWLTNYSSKCLVTEWLKQNGFVVTEIQNCYGGVQKYGAHISWRFY